MSNQLSRMDPFASPFDDLFKGFFLRPVRFDAAPEAPQLKVDVTEDATQYSVKAELPGVSKDDIHVSIDGPRLSIAAEIRRESEKKDGEQVIRSERYYGRTVRSFSMDSEIDADAAKAEYRDGILQLTLPKRTGETTRKLPIA